MSDAATAQPPAPDAPGQDIYYVSTYLVRGSVKRGQFRGEPAWTDPPTAGFAHLFVVPGKKQSTLFCPFSLQSANVPNRCMEIRGAKPLGLDDPVPVGDPIWEEVPSEYRDRAGKVKQGVTYVCTKGSEGSRPRRDGLVEIINRRWELACKLGIGADFDIAAVVLNRLGAPVPTYVRPSAVEADGSQKERGGKPMDEARLRFVNPNSVRGRVLKFFLEAEPPTRSIREAMAELDMGRSNVLSHLFTLNKEHGIGYTLAADCGTVLMPEGWNPFDAPPAPEPRAAADSPSGGATEGASSPQPTRAPKGRGKATDPARLSPIVEGSKRAAVALHFAKGWDTVAGCEAATGIGARSIQSHLHDIHSYHGLGHEVDGDRVRIVVPDGFKLTGPKPERQRKAA